MAHRNPLHRHRDPPWQKPKEWSLNRPEEAFPPERFQIGIAGEIISEWWAISFRNAGRFGSESAPGYIASMAINSMIVLAASTVTTSSMRVFPVSRSIAP